MLPSALSLAVFLAVLFAVGSAGASPSTHRGVARRHRNHLNRDLSASEIKRRDDTDRTPITTTTGRRVRRSRSCIKKPSTPQSQSAAASTSKAAAPKTTDNTKVAPTPAKPVGDAAPAPVLNSKGKPSNWPTETQAGAAPSATRTSAADPFLLSLSKAYNNANNPLFMAVHTGQMTYYGQGLGACGDTYDDKSLTAAVSKIMYDAWPGAIADEVNRNPICGPFVTGRKVINQQGNFVTAVPGAQFVNVGGDGLLNCDPTSQCHIPLTATVQHGGKSVIVQIVDRCEACAEGDIDLTPAAFGKLADLGVGRAPVEWFFNNYQS